MANNKYKAYIIIIAGILIAASTFMNTAVFSYAQTDEKNVLILNSYHRGFLWTDQKVDAITEKFNQNETYSTSLFIEYMDWKNHPTYAKLELLKQMLKYRYENQNIDIIIATDDAALEFALQNTKEIFDDAPIVFTGVSTGNYKSLTLGFDNVTGVVEEAEIEETLKLAMEINENIRLVYVLHDYTESGIAMGKSVAQSIKNSNLPVHSISFAPMSAERILEEVKNLPQNSMILITTFHRDSRGTIIDNPLITSMVSEVSPVPVFSLYEMSLGHGAIGGKVISGTFQGEIAAELAMRVLDGEDIREIDVVKNGTTKLVVDYDELSKFGFPLNKIPKEATILNKPLSIMDEYKDIVYIGISARALLSIFLIILSIALNRLVTAKKKLQENNIELNALYNQIAASEEELKQMAYHDNLTGLPNRESLKEDIETHHRYTPDDQGIFMVIDIDDFKYINDTMGHTFGDKMLIEIAKKLRQNLKQELKLYRIGGDEYIVWCSSDLESPEKLAQEISVYFNEAIHVGDSVLQVDVSMGISIYPQDGRDSDSLMKNADIAMYEAKRLGKGRYIFYNDDMKSIIVERAEIEQKLRTALENNEFELYFQPQFDILKNEIWGVEALIRWKSPTLGTVSPDKFIKIAEDSQKIVAIGKWVFEESCRFAKKLYMMGYYKHTVAVNISVIQLMQEDFNDFILDTIKKYDLSYKTIEIELTESVLMRSIDDVYEKLNILKDIGIRIALDDFGTGYSSLSYLKALPITTLKIDKSFIRDMENDLMTENLTSSIISLAHQLDLEVVAEGVENLGQFERIRKYKGNRIQGYYFAKPMPEEDIIAFIDKISGRI